MATAQPTAKTNIAPAVIGLGQMALSPLFGKLFGGGGPDYSNILSILQKYFGPAALQGDTQKMYQMGLASPGFQNQLQGINLAGNQFNQNYAAGQARMGMGGDSARSGVGAVGAAAAPTLSSMHRGQAYGGLWDQSQNSALQMLLGRMQGLTQGHMQPGMGQMDLTRMLFGAGMSGLSDYFGNKGLSQGGSNGGVQGPVQPGAYTYKKPGY